MATEKVVSYTAEQTAELVTRYQAGETVEALAEAMGKTVKSIVSKLSREGVYVSKTKTSKAKQATKAELVTSIAAKLGVTEDKVESLEKATREVLVLLHGALALAEE
jgi:hypothetical protein